MIHISKNSSAKAEMLLEIQPKLAFMFFDIVDFLSKNYPTVEVMITSIIRPASTIKGETGIHSQKRGIDFILVNEKDLSVHGPYGIVHQKLINLYNNFYPYDTTRPSMKTLIWHKMDGGSEHMHLQVKP
jgi:hypothetical protein